MLAIAVGQALTKHMHELLEQMFQVGLSESFRQALTDVSTNIPPLLPLIQGKFVHGVAFLFRRTAAQPTVTGVVGSALPSAWITRPYFARSVWQCNP